MRILPIVLLVLILFSCDSQRVDTQASSADWAVYQGEGSNQATTLSQITHQNVGALQKAWEYHCGDIPEHSQIQCNPLIINGTVYLSTPTLEIAALNGVSGEEIWRTSPAELLSEDEVPSPGMGVNRGLVYANTAQGPRIFSSSGPYLYCLNAESGQLISDFGTNGKVDLRSGLGEAHEKAFVVANSPGAVYQDKLIMGCRVSESQGAAPGYIRAYNLLSGNLEWTFHTIPRESEEGYDTWDSSYYSEVGGANAWAGLTVDHKNGMVFIPTGSASYDFYGANRTGDNLYANCLLALNAATGEKVWHFQVVHHDLLDRDLPAPPNLITLKKNGKEIEAVAQITKTGHVFVFDRLTGDPVFPIEEREVPQSDLPGETSSPTQPFTSVPSFSRQTIETVFEHAEGRDSLQARLNQMRKRSIYEPPSIEGTLVFPGYDGGGEWGGAAFDPWNGYLVVNSSQMAWTLEMIPAKSQHPGHYQYLLHCSSCHGADLAGGEFMGKIPTLQSIGEQMDQVEIISLLNSGRGAMPTFAHLGDDKLEAITDFLTGKDRNSEGDQEESYVSSGYNRFLDKQGYPAIQPPWGLLTAIDLNKGELVWQVTLGEYEELTEQGIPPTGTENYGGPVVTKSGLTFIAATADERIRAFNTTTGELLWEDKLPASGFATPSMYEVDGTQYLIIACGGTKSGMKAGDSYVAYRLP